MEETIFIASDHAGFDLKKQILNSIENNLVDLGVDNKNSFIHSYKVNNA